MSPSRLCAEPSCPDPQVYRGRCQRHARQRNRETRSANASIYNTKRWQMTRRRKLSETPLCETPDCQRIAEHVHHRTDLAAGGDPWALEGLEALCASHHNQETRRRQMDGVGDGP